jgi:hypothetical protein
MLYYLCDSWKLKLSHSTIEKPIEVLNFRERCKEISNTLAGEGRWCPELGEQVTECKGRLLMTGQGAGKI